MTNNLLFVYVNSKGFVNIQAIDDVYQNDEYIQGISLLERDEGKIKTFRKDRVLGYFNTTDEAQNFIDESISSGFLIPAAPKHETFDICFTGFKKERRTELESLATQQNMLVRKSVTKSLKLLCYGYNAGPTKIKNAREMGILILGESQFIRFLETGDITESV